MVNCADYCMFISAPGAVFLLYLAILVSFGSETVYSVPKSRFESSIVLFLASFVYAGFFGFCYYSKYMTIERRENVENWINEHDTKLVEMEQVSQVRQQFPKSENVSELQKQQGSHFRQSEDD